MIQNNPNLDNLIKVAKKLGELREQIVFIGGCAVGLLITDTAAPGIRPTQDVDFIVEIATRKEYYEFSEQLKQKGFVEDCSTKILCRWRLGDCIVDVMPTNSDVLGFSNRWYTEAMSYSIQFDLTPKLSIRLVSAPYFVATKIEAFHGRGKNDFLMSVDIEDIISVIDGRNELLSEIKASPKGLREYIAQEISSMLKVLAFTENLSGFVPGDPGSQARVPKLLVRLKEIALIS